MVWCETVEFDKGTCKGCSDKFTILEILGLSAIGTIIEYKNNSVAVAEFKDYEDTKITLRCQR